MINIYKTNEDNVLTHLDELNEDERGLWLNVVNPSDEELESLATFLDIDQDTLRYPLDENERSRIEVDDNYTLLIVNYPAWVSGGYTTHVIGIFLTDNAVVTISQYNPLFLDQFSYGKVKSFITQKKGRFVFQIFDRITSLFITYLSQTEKRLDTAEERLKTATENAELIKLMELNNSLTYFSTALRGNQTVFEKISRSDPFRIYEEDRELLEEIIIESKQAIEMNKTYLDVLSSTMEAYASIISNNLNSVMKFMTVWTIAIMVPTLYTTFFGMNVLFPFANTEWFFWFIVITSIIMMVSLMIYFKAKKFW